MKQKLDDFLKENISQINKVSIESLNNDSLNNEFEDNLMTKINIINNRNQRFNKSKTIIKDYSKVIISSFIFILIATLSLIIYLVLQTSNIEMNINNGQDYSLLLDFIDSKILIISFTFFIFILLDQYIFNKKQKLV